MQVLLGFLLISVSLGQLGKLPLSWFGEGGIYISDLLVGIIWLVWIIHSLKNRNAKITLLDITIINLLLILGISLLNSVTWVPMGKLLIGIFYYLRIILYFSLFFIIKIYLPNIPRILMITITLLFVCAGLIQFSLFPNFAQFISLGWDPHYYRVLSTFFDPNYAGCYFICLFLYFLNSAYKLKTKTAKLINMFMLILLLIPLILTYSRSTYLGFIVALGVFSLLKDRRIIIGLIVTCLLVFMLIPRVQTRVIGAFAFDDTVRIRFSDYQKSINIIEDNNQLFGVGFNNLRYAKESGGYFRDLRGVNQESGHSGAGADSSLLFILITSGIIGLAAYLGFLIVLIVTCNKSTERALTLSLCLSLIVHSQFVNSFFYIPILTLFIFLISDNQNLGREYRI